MKKSFASDNAAGIHPTVLQAIHDANQGHVTAYGDDPYTERALTLFKQHFGQQSETYFVCSGTGANVLAMQAMLQSHQAVMCVDSAHIHEHECGAPEKFTGSKLLTVPGEQGKLSIASLQQFLPQLGFEHMVQPKAISISQSTELGTVYSLNEIAELVAFAKQHNFYVHSDGARLANAAAALNLNLAQLTTELGIDVVSFGGTKNGLMIGEAVVFCNPALAEQFPYIRKQGMQLLSKMRYLSAQFIVLLENDLYLNNARHANQMASYFAEQLQAIEAVEITQPVETNMVFVKFPLHLIEQLQSVNDFYVLDNEDSVARLVTSFDTTQQDIDQFIAHLKRLINN